MSIRYISKNSEKKRTFFSDVCMTEGSIPKNLLIYTIPVLLSGILQLLFNTADLVVVGRYASDSKKALAAVGSTGALTNLIICMFLGLSVGTCVVLSQKLGAQDDEAASKTVHSSMWISFVVGIFLGIVGIAIVKRCLELMNTPADVIDWSVLYMRIYFAGMPASMIYNFGSAILRAKGDTKTPLIIMLSAGIANIVMNVITVKYLGWDVAGVASATTLSLIISAALVVGKIMRLDDCCKLKLREMRPDWKTILEIAKVGVPAGLQSMCFNISNVIIQTGVNDLGMIAMAGNTAAGNIDGYLYIACNSTYHGAMAFTGQNYGAGQIKRIKNIAISASAICFSIGAILGIIAIVFRNPLLRLYAPGDTNIDVREIGESRVIILALTYYFCGLMEVFSGIVRGMGRSLLSTGVTVIGTLAFRLIWVYGVFFKYETMHTLFWLYVSYPISWVIILAALMIVFLIIYKKELAKYNAKLHMAKILGYTEGIHGVPRYLTETDREKE